MMSSSRPAAATGTGLIAGSETNIPPCMQTATLLAVAERAGEAAIGERVAEETHVGAPLTGFGTALTESNDVSLTVSKDTLPVASLFITPTPWRKWDQMGLEVSIGRSCFMPSR